MKQSPYSMIMLFVAFGFSLFIYVLSGYHHYLTCLNNTTNENLKKTFKLTGNPFRKNYCQTLWELCRPKFKKMLWKPKKEVPRSEVYKIDWKQKEADDVMVMSESNDGQKGKADSKVKPGEIYMNEDEIVIDDNADDLLIMSGNVDNNQLKVTSMSNNLPGNFSRSVFYNPIQKMEIYDSGIIINSKI